MKTRLALARSVLHDPELLLFDEPTSGLDPESALAVLELIREMTEQGRTVLMCTHLLLEAEGLADQVVVMQHGTSLVWGAPGDLATHVLADIRSCGSRVHDGRGPRPPGQRTRRDRPTSASGVDATARGRRSRDRSPHSSPVSSKPASPITAGRPLRPRRSRTSISPYVVTGGSTRDEIVPPAIVDRPSRPSPESAEMADRSHDRPRTHRRATRPGSIDGRRSAPSPGPISSNSSRPRTSGSR